MKILKQCCIMFISACIVISGISLISTDHAYASSIHLSTTYTTIAKGGKKTIKLYGKTGTWKIADSSIATLKNKKKGSVVVVPKKAGKTVLTCKAGKKKLKCTIKVLNSKIGNPKAETNVTIIKGTTYKRVFPIEGDQGVKTITTSKSIAKVSFIKSTKNHQGTLKIKALKAGSLPLTITYNNGTKTKVKIHLVPGFRGSAKYKKSEKNYKKWRKAWIRQAVKSDMTTWDIIDSLRYLINSGKYSYDGGVSGMQLWYGGNGTCVSGAQMLHDFLKDMGLNSTLHFAGNDPAEVDIYGMYTMPASQHKNVILRLGGGKYVVNAQPEGIWPYGIIRRK